MGYETKKPWYGVPSDGAIGVVIDPKFNIRITSDGEIHPSFGGIQQFWDKYPAFRIYFVNDQSNYYDDEWNTYYEFVKDIIAMRGRYLYTEG